MMLATQILWYFVTLMSLLSQCQVESAGTIWIRMQSFINPDGEGDNGNCCDGRYPFCQGNGCDHYFTICFDNPGGSMDITSCPIGQIQTDYITNSNSITFESSIGDTPNPFTIRTRMWPSAVKLKVQIYDYDSARGNSDDYVDSLTSTLTFQPLRSLQEEGFYDVSVSRRTRLRFRLKVACDENYYGDCTTYCLPRLSRDHYTCNPISGAKICHPGWRGSNCNVMIDYCESSPCENGGSCDSRLSGYTCHCIQGFAGDHCEVNVNECLRSPCENQGNCVDVIGSFTCLCQDGYTGDLCGEEIDECLSASCLHDSECVDLVAEYICLCHVGYTGIHCEVEVDECHSLPCHHDADCEDRVASYRCHCPPGYRGRNCETDVNECVSSPCHEDSLCLDEINRYRCVCPNHRVGEHCDFLIDWCDSSPCGHEAECQSFPEGFQCTCPPGWQGSRCDTSVNECLSDPCLNGATCEDQRARFTCRCRAGYTGVHCESDLDECVISSPCEHGGSCHNVPGSYSCSCLVDYSGQQCQTQLNFCMSSPCENGASCTSGGGAYSCSCLKGFIGNRCEEEVNECLSNPCLHDARCNDMIGQYYCICAHGWTGEDCHERIPPCLNNPCLNNGSCVEDGLTYRCECGLLYKGSLCDVFDPCLGEPCQHGGTCLNMVENCLDDQSTAVCNENVSRLYECQCDPTHTGEVCEIDVTTSTTVTTISSTSSTSSTTDKGEDTTRVKEASNEYLLLKRKPDSGEADDLAAEIRFMVAQHLGIDENHLTVAHDQLDCSIDGRVVAGVFAFSVSYRGEALGWHILEESLYPDNTTDALLGIHRYEGPDCTPNLDPEHIPNISKVSDAGDARWTWQIWVIVCGTALLLLLTVIMIILAIRRIRTNRRSSSYPVRPSISESNPLYGRGFSFDSDSGLLAPLPEEHPTNTNYQDHPEHQDGRDHQSVTHQQGRDHQQQGQDIYPKNFRASRDLE